MAAGPRTDSPERRASADAGHQRGGLLRVLSGFANTAMTYSIVGPTTGLVLAFGLGLVAGPAFIWGWPLVGAGVLTICLMWAELASHYPYAGAMYHWPAILAGRHAGWLIGWMYLFAGIVLVTAYYFLLSLAVIPLFHLSDTQGTAVAIALVALVIAAGIHAAGERVLGRFPELAVVAEWFILVVITTLVIIFGGHRSPTYLFNTGSLHGFGAWFPKFLVPGLFPGLIVMFMFETGGTLGEETREARRRAPRGVLGAWAVTVVLGMYFLVGFLLGIGKPGPVAASANPVVTILGQALPHVWTDIFLVLFGWVCILGGNVAFAAVARTVYSMARAGQLPFSSALRKTRQGTPWVALLVVAVLSGLPFIVTQDIPVLATGLTAMIYVIYFVVMCIVFAARLRGWPKEAAPFSLRRWGIPVNVLAILFSGGFLALLLSKTELTNPPWKLGIPVAYWLIGVPLVVGVIYYVTSRRSATAPVTTPSDEAEVAPIGALGAGGPAAD
jgi:amino acid transporter